MESDLNKNKLVLFVDDDDDFREMLGELLELDDVKVVLSSSTKDAKEKILEINPDLLITDLNLPDGNGLDLSKYFKEKCPRGSVIMLTGEVDLDISDSFVDRVFQKPFDIDVLINTIESF